MDSTAYETFNFCPVCGEELKMVGTSIDDIKRCEDHPFVLYPSQNEHGEQVMVYDPNRPKRMWRS